jgi:spermidine synthase
LYADRSFFGSYRATLHADGKRHVLFQGTTVHGAQNTDPQMRLKPLTYFHRTGPAGQILSLFAKLHNEGHVAIIGLGTGALACHGSAGQTFTFYEIDPLVEKIARDDSLFTYLRDCPPKITVVIGDARLSLAKAAGDYYNLFVLDAFSSDVIPTHLLTRQALQLYIKKTTAEGILLAHISNRYMDLAPVVRRLAENLNLVTYIQNDFDITSTDSAEGKSASRWVMLAHREKDVAPFLASQRWQRLIEQSTGDLWTDDFTNLLKVINWH